MQLEVALVDLVAAELLADASPREAAMLGAQLDSPAVFLEDALEVGALDPAGELGGDLGERPAVIEVEMERFIVASDDLRRQVFGLDQGAAGGDGRLLERVLELADVARPVVAQEPRERLSRERLDRAGLFSAILSRKWLTRSGISSSRSRNGGSSIETTLRR